MDVEKLKRQIEEITEKIETGETIQVNVKGKNEDGEKQTLPLKVSRRSGAKVSSTNAPANDKTFRGRNKDGSFEDVSQTSPTFELDLTSVEISDEEIQKVIEDASKRAKKEFDKIIDKETFHRTKSLENGVPFVVITLRPEEKLWEVYEECRYKPEGDGHTLIAPKGYKTDLASIPRIFWAIIASFELSLAAPVFHDLLYQSAGELTKEKIDPFPRKKFERSEADKIFLELMTKANVPRWKREVAYYAVSYGAWWAWKKRDF